MNSDRMAAADAACLHMDRPDNLMVVNCVFWFDGQLDWNAWRPGGRVVSPAPCWAAGALR